MEAKELRIGNYVYHANIVNDDVSIIEVTLDVIIYMVLGGSLNKYKPIPLTEEWLLKFGFKKGQIQLTTYTNGKLSITLKTNEYVNGRTYFNSWCILEKQIQYVHQLQNLYFALTGEELKTTL